MSDLQKLLALLILKAAPQDLHYSRQSPMRYAMAYIVSGVFVLQTTLNSDDMVEGLLLGLIVQYLFIYLVLRALNYNARFAQTFSAVLGVSILFNLLSWPVFYGFTGEVIDESLTSLMSLIFLLIISWEVLVKAHIFKHALEMKMFSALALSFSLFFISVALSQLLFPAVAAG